MGLPITHRRQQRAFNRAYVGHKTKKHAIAQRRQAEFANAAFQQFAEVVKQQAIHHPAIVEKEKLN